MSQPDNAHEILVERAYERSLGLRAAQMRFVLTLVSLAVITVDHFFTNEETFQNRREAYSAGFAFATYALVAWLGLRTQFVSLARYQRLTPILDIAFSSGLVLATEGYLSPFTSWFGFAVICSAFGASPRKPIYIACLAFFAHLIIARIPQTQPLDLTFFIVRSGFLFAVALMLSLISLHLTQQSSALRAVETVAGQLSASISAEEGVAVLLSGVMSHVAPAGARVRLDEGFELTGGKWNPARPPQHCVSLRTAGLQLGVLELQGARLNSNTATMLRLICDRTASALLRMRATRDLAAAAGVTERLRVLDEVHDGYVQTLAALDLHTESVLSQALRDAPQLGAGLRGIKRIARQAAADVRRILQPPPQTDPGPQRLLELMAERGPLGTHARIDPEASLTRAQWEALEMLVREGLNNARKHAAASMVELRIAVTADATHCFLDNDGAPLKGPPAPGYGLRRVTDLIRAEGGEFQIANGPAGGARLTATFRRNGAANGNADSALHSSTPA